LWAGEKWHRNAPDATKGHSKQDREKVSTSARRPKNKKPRIVNKETRTRRKRSNSKERLNSPEATGT